MIEEPPVSDPSNGHSEGEEHEDSLSWPEEGTGAAQNYFNAAKSDLDFFNFLINTILHVDYAAHIAKTALENLPMDEGNPVELATRSPGTGIRYLRKNRQAFLEMFLTRLVDNFQNILWI